MSDEKQPTPAEVKAAIAAKVAELKALIGHKFQRKDGTGQIVTVSGYGGIHIRTKIVNGQRVSESCHGIWVDEPGNRWQPVAADFLANYEPVTTE